MHSPPSGRPIGRWRKGAAGQEPGHQEQTKKRTDDSVSQKTGAQCWCHRGLRGQACRGCSEHLLAKTPKNEDKCSICVKMMAFIKSASPLGRLRHITFKPGRAFAPSPGSASRPHSVPPGTLSCKFPFRAFLVGVHILLAVRTPVVRGCHGPAAVSVVLSFPMTLRPSGPPSWPLTAVVFGPLPQQQENSQ